MIVYTYMTINNQPTLNMRLSKDHTLAYFGEWELGGIWLEFLEPHIFRRSPQKSETCRVFQPPPRLVGAIQNTAGALWVSVAPHTQGIKQLQGQHCTIESVSSWH